MMRGLSILCRVERTIREGRGEDSEVKAVNDGKRSLKVQEEMGVVGG